MVWRMVKIVMIVMPISFCLISSNSSSSWLLFAVAIMFLVLSFIALRCRNAERFKSLGVERLKHVPWP